jgi:hypothetical protein
LPTASWFCRKAMKAVAGNAAEGSPRGLPPRNGEGWP